MEVEVVIASMGHASMTKAIVGPIPVIWSRSMGGSAVETRVKIGDRVKGGYLIFYAIVQNDRNLCETLHIFSFR